MDVEDEMMVYCPIFQKKIYDGDCYEIVYCGYGDIKKTCILKSPIGMPQLQLVKNVARTRSLLKRYQRFNFLSIFRYFSCCAFI